MYGREIQKLVACKECLTDPEDRTKLFQQAIWLSNGNKDIKSSVDLRLDLIEEEIFKTQQQHHLSIQAISWGIGAYEQNPSVIEEQDFLCQYKRVVNHVTG